MGTVSNSSNINTSSTTAASAAVVPVGGRSGKSVSSPWTHIVRGESEPIAAAPSSPSASSSPALIEQAVPPSASSSTSSMADDEGSDNGNGPNGNAGKKPAWNKPSNGAVEIGPVMGAVSWPALSESTKLSAKSSSDSLKGLADGSTSASIAQVTGTAPTPSQKQVSNNANPNQAPNHTISTRQRPMKRNTANTSANGGAPQSSSQGPGEVHLNNPSPRDHGQRNSQLRGANDHPQQRNSFRNRNGGPHSRGDVSHSHNYGGRRDQDRGNQDWNAHRNFNGRDAHMQPQRGVPRFRGHAPPPPPQTATTIYIPPSLTSGRPPFPAPMAFHEFGSTVLYVPAPPPDSLRGVPYVPTSIPPHPMYFPPPDLQLHSRIVNQIDYYFSNENLIKDTFLRQNMDDQGWVPIKLIAGFNKVSNLTDNIQLILDAVRSSTVVEVKDDKVRKRNDWNRWIMPPTVQFPNVSSPRSSGNSSQDMLAAHMQSMSMEDSITNRNTMTSHANVNGDAVVSRSTSGDLSSQSQISINLEMAQVVQGGSDHPTTGRNSK